jgi:hypothetical protein
MKRPQLGMPWWRLKQAKVAKVYAINPKLSTSIYTIIEIDNLRDAPGSRGFSLSAYS